MTISRFILLTMKNTSDLLCRANQSVSESRAFYEIMWKFTVQQDRPQMTTQHGDCALHAG